MISHGDNGGFDRNAPKPTCDGFIKNFRNLRDFEAKH